jgi:hypothetical protein
MILEENPILKTALDVMSGDSDMLTVDDKRRLL